MSINFEAKYELDLDWVSDDLGSFYLAAELAEARVIRYRENPSDYRSQDPAVIAFLKKNGLNTAALEARAKADRLNGVNPTKPAAAGQGKSARWWRALRQNQRGTERGE
ncbi:MAG: hypothetical protein DLM55_05265 [Acidimicrobiales bacterium]|nr:MAG: hypothetical protein DLM55_05265 [Acidimicrobiales bacterium]